MQCRRCGASAFDKKWQTRTPASLAAEQGEVTRLARLLCAQTLHGEPGNRDETIGLLDAALSGLPNEALTEAQAAIIWREEVERERAATAHTGGWDANKAVLNAIMRAGAPSTDVSTAGPALHETGVSLNVAGLVERLRPNIGAETDEPSLGEMVLNYYRAHYEIGQAFNRRDRYFAALPITKAADALATLSRADDGWRTMESAPMDGTLILLAGCYCGGPAFHIAEWRRGYWKVDTEDGWWAFDWDPTHWRYLPAAPVQEAGE